MRIALIVLFAACNHPHALTGDGGDTIGGDGASGDGAVSSCDPPGHFGVPTATFALPSGQPAISYSDIQAAFPNVDWANLDRLYLPAGHYTSILLGNLPARTAEHPLVITNQGGQFFVGDNPQGNFLWSFSGGSHWILTGRYDPVSLTGDIEYPGHACGNYASSPGHYGIESDDGFAFAAPYLHMGIAVGAADNFEIEYVEVQRSGFAGIRLLNDPTTTDPMPNVSVHDTYVHDTGAEGYYFGWTGDPPSNKLAGLQVYNNRIVRTGNEALQIQDLGDGSHVYNNTFVSGGLHWFDNGLGRYQDNNSQIDIRDGAIEIDHNVFIDGANTITQFFIQPEAGDGDAQVSLHDNYWSDSVDLGMYMNGSPTDATTVAFDGNVFRGLVFGYGEIDPAMPATAIGTSGAYHGPVTFTNNRWSGVPTLAAPSASWSFTGNTNTDPGAIQLNDGPWTMPGHHLTAWAPNITVNGGSTPAQYNVGDVATNGATPTLYMATRASTGGSGTEPEGDVADWTALPPPSDDVRVVPGSHYDGYGVN
ncbi:MAG TPA: hypothetical protein VH143_08560 [Kofleriaceae bacterium]|nr:hypothetical protein [Kofleriaceae bacterium]